jgi:conjugal transfer ATP-binding protein TraC
MIHVVNNSINWIREKLAFDSGNQGTPAEKVKSGTLPPSIARQRDYFENFQFSDLLPYNSYDPETGLFKNDDNYGFVLKLSTLVGATEETYKVISGIFTGNLPAGTGVQFTLVASPNIMPLFKRWARHAKTDEDKVMVEEWENPEEKRSTNMYRWLRRKRIEYLKNSFHKSLFDDQAYNLRDYHLYISVCFPYNNSDMNVSDKAIQEAINHRSSIISMLKAASMSSLKVDANHFLYLMDEILNPKYSQKNDSINWNEGKLLKHQMIDGESNILIDQDGMTINESDVRSYSVKSYPAAWAIWGMGELIGDTFKNAQRIPGHFLITLGVYVPDQEVLQKKVSLKSARATQNADSVMAKFNPSMAEQKKDWDFVTRKLNDGGSLVYGYHQIILFSPLGEGDHAEHALKSLYRAKNWTLQRDRYMQTQGLLAALPMTLTPTFKNELTKMGRINMMLTHTAGNMVPIITEWKGTGTPTLMLFGRRGQIMFIDPFDNDKGNFNIACTAASGAGKSFFTQEFCVSILGSGGRVWVIDVGRSYEKLCNILDGQFIEFTEAANININPFTHIKDFKEAIKILKPLVGQMAKPRKGYDDNEAAFIEQAITMAWREKGSEATITTIRDALNSIEDDRAIDLARMLNSYCKDGMYENYFEGTCTLDFKKDFIVLELEELNSMPELQPVVLMILMFQITENMYLGERNQRKLCIIDEAWALMTGDTGIFIETGYRRARKYGGAFMTVTQSIEDYYKTPASTAAFNNSDWVFMLRQRPESVDQLKSSKKISMDDSMERIMKSVTTVQGSYSEIFVYGPIGVEVGRLVVDKFSGLLYSTRAEEFNLINQLQKSGKTIVEAIEAIIEAKEKDMEQAA